MLPNINSNYMKTLRYLDIIFTTLFIVKLVCETMIDSKTINYLERSIYGYATLRMAFLLYFYYNKTSTE